MKVTVASCQIDVSSFSMEKNITACEEAVKEAVAKGAQICLLPELALTGYTVACYNRSQAQKAMPFAARLEGLAQELSVHVFAGYLHEENGRLRNTQGYFTPNGLAGVYFKNELVAHENLFAVPGTGPVIYDTPFGRIGCAICKDMLYKDVFAPYRGRVDMMAISSAWPDLSRDYKWGPLGRAARHSDRLIRELPQRIARYVGAPVVYCDSWGGPHPLFGSDAWMIGGSSIVTPEGFVEKGITTGEQMLLAELELKNTGPVDDNDPWPSRGHITPVLAVERALCKAAGLARSVREKF